MRLSASLIAAGLLAGCATAGVEYDPSTASSLKPGTPMDAVIAQMGKPTSSATAPSGETVLIWSFAEVNGFSGSTQSRSVALQFDTNGKLLRKAGESNISAN